MTEAFAQFIADNKTLWPEELPHKDDNNLIKPGILAMVNKALLIPDLCAITAKKADIAHRIIRGIRQIRAWHSEETKQDQVNAAPPVKIDPYNPQVQKPAGVRKVLPHASPGLWYQRRKAGDPAT